MRQTSRHLFGRIDPAERAELAGWLTPAELARFDGMHPADRRHGLDVLARLRLGGADGDRELLVAGLLHDCGKGRAGLVARIAWSLSEAVGAWVLRLGALLPSLRNQLELLAGHAARSADLVRSDGGSERTARLIREQDAPTDAAGALLHAADEAS